MNKTELAKIIREHMKWLVGEGGSRANLSDADLSRANLSRADLSNADLSRANLSGANLKGANLGDANLSRAYLGDAYLRGARLSDADLKNTMLESINWLAYIGIVPNKSGIAYAYKITEASGEGIYNGGINYTEGIKFEVDEVDPGVNTQCSYGINLATFAWCLNKFAFKTYRLFMFKFNVKDAVCPIGSDGKFRVKKCTKVGECDWQGNLLKAVS